MDYFKNNFEQLVIHLEKNKTGFLPCSVNITLSCTKHLNLESKTWNFLDVSGKLWLERWLGGWVCSELAGHRSSAPNTLVKQLIPSTRLGSLAPSSGPCRQLHSQAHIHEQTQIYTHLLNKVTTHYLQDTKMSETLVSSRHQNNYKSYQSSFFTDRPTGCVWVGEIVPVFLISNEVW